MKKTFKPSEIMSERGCYSKEQVKELSFYAKKIIHIKDVFSSELPLKDAYWYLFRKCDLTLKEKLAHCLDLAEIVLPIYEKNNPNDSRVRECIEGIKKYNKGEITKDELWDLRRTADAYAAYAAAYAAYAYADAAAAAAADAAYAYAAAADAAYADAAAAYADAAYAYAAAAAAADADAAAEIKESLISCTIKFIDLK